MDKVEYFHSKCKHISYPVLNGIFADLTKEEKQQVTDYILYKYNFLSYESLENLFGSFEKMCLAVDSNAGSEFDIEEEYGDHSCYRAMLSIVRDLGFTEHIQYILLLHEAHLAVDLGEFWLAVGAQVLVTEAAYDLEIAVVTCHHQELLEGLGGLRKGVELSSMAVPMFPPLKNPVTGRI